MKITQLRVRIISYFVGAALLISALYGAVAFVFAYYVEDNFLNALLNSEAKAIHQQVIEKRAPSPRLEFVTFHATVDELPLFVRNTLSAQPKRREFAAPEGRHYHLLKFEQGYLLADVSSYLVVRENKQIMLSYLLILLAIVTAIAALVGFAAYRIAKRLLRPLDELKAIVEQAPVEQLPQGFAKRFQKDEIGSFANALEQALVRIKAFVQREQHFTRDVSHELRTPTTISRGALTLLKQTSLSADQTPLVTRIEQAQVQIEQSLSTLLALAREDNNAVTQTRLLPVVEQSIIQQHQFLADKDIELVISIKPQQEVPIAETPLLILLNNLIGNAFKYTVSGTISVIYDKQTLLIRDSGKGIDSTLQPHVFEAGVKGQTSQGLGMGLSIVKRLCEQFSIDYRVKSSGDGTEFSIRFSD
ncbi:MAG: sensor histidine kinase [Psychrobium sp.]